MNRTLRQLNRKEKMELKTLWRFALIFSLCVACGVGMFVRTLRSQSRLFADGMQLKIVSETPTKKPISTHAVSFSKETPLYQLTEISCYEQNDVADAVSFDAEGNAWFLSAGADKEIKIDPETLLVTEYKLPRGSGPRSNAIARSGAHWIISMRFDVLLETYPQQGVATVRKPPGQGFMNYLVASRQHDTVWYSKPSENVIGRYHREIGFKEYRIPTFDSGPGRFGIDSKGNIWFPQLYGNKLAKFDPVSEKFAEYPLPVENALPVFVLVDSNDDVWVAQHTADRIARFRNGKFDDYRVPTSNSGVNALAEAPDGTIWFAEGGWRGSVSSNRLGRLNPRTGAIEELTLPTPNSQPVALSIDKKGNVWFVEMGTGKIGLIQKQAEARSATQLSSR